jgi:hypothetical protein
MVISMALADITLQILINTMRVNLDCQIWKEKEVKLGQMAVVMKVILRMAKKTEKEYSHGLLELNISVAGEMLSSMGLAFCIILRMEQRSKESGIMGRE